MAKLSVAQKTIKDIFENEKTDFLVPDYQRKYDWGESECERLWDDLLAFTFPDNDPDSFDSNNDEFFLGSIVTFNNENKQEIIDGQQRLVTFLLIFRAFYEKFINIQDDSSNKIRDLIERCIFKTDENFNPDKNKLKIESRVATESDNEEFLLILKNGVTQKSQKSNYAKNYTFFKDKIDDFLQQYPSYFSYLPYRILNNCILLHIETELQDTALRIFSTLNDRGKSLSDTDIFKSQLYKFFSDKGFKDRFNYQWKDLERVCEEIFPSVKGNPMNELFTRYMYFIRAKNANHGKMSFTNAALRKMYEKDGYSILRNEETFKHLIILAKFWEKVFCEDDDFFSEDVLRRLFVLNYSPNNMWNNLVSVYYLQNKDKDGKLNQTLFESFLDKITAFILTYTITNPGTNTLRIPVYAEMVNIIKGIPVSFEKSKFDISIVQAKINLYNFSNRRSLTKSILAWWALNNQNQPRPSIKESFDVEHIYSRNRCEKEHDIVDKKIIELLGNKILLEKRINIRASDYRFIDKAVYYRGDGTKKKEGTQIIELRTMAENIYDFTEREIKNRNERIIIEFLNYLRKNKLTKELDDSSLF